MLCATVTSIGGAIILDVTLLLKALDICHWNAGAELSNSTPKQAGPVCEVVTLRSTSCKQY